MDMQVKVLTHYKVEELGGQYGCFRFFKSLRNVMPPILPLLCYSVDHGFIEYLLGSGVS